MQIVIEIKEEDYVDIMASQFLPNFIKDAIKNGTVLPDDHGRLIDADAFENNLKWNENINNAPTIIEADKAERGDKE